MFKLWLKRLKKKNINFKKNYEKDKFIRFIQNLNNKIINLENEIKIKSIFASLSSSTIARKKYNYKIINKKDNTYQYDVV